jgi:hypothetical protein
MRVLTRIAALSGPAGARAGNRMPGVALALAMGLALVAATAPLTPALAQKAMAEDCELTMEQTWLGDLVATAHVSGECGLTTIELEVSNNANEVVWSESYGSGDLFGFDDVLDKHAMRVAIGDWLGAYADNTSSGTLPEWPQGADMPDAGEFPFYVEDGLSRQDYEAFRAADYPMICYIQGRESSLCLVKMPDDGTLTPIGAQSFPG